jgi:hypothetical protein
VAEAAYPEQVAPAGQDGHAWRKKVTLFAKTATAVPWFALCLAVQT